MLTKVSNFLGLVAVLVLNVKSWVLFLANFTQEVMGPQVSFARWVSVV